MNRLAVLVAAFIYASDAAATDRAAHNISVRIDPQTRAIEGRDTVRLEAPRAITLLLAPGMRIESIVADGYDVRAPSPSAGGGQHIPIPASRRIDVRGHGTLDALEQNPDHRRALTYNEPATSAAGTYLPAG